VKKLLNTLFITREGAYVHKERETIRVECDGEKALQLPAHGLSDIHCFGRVMVSPALMGFCAEQGIGLAFYTEHGRYLASVQGPYTGNVLLRRSQHRRADNEPVGIARSIIAAKLVNGIAVLRRHGRNHGEDPDVSAAADSIRNLLGHVRRAESMDRLRGYEGEAAACYFAALPYLVRPGLREAFSFAGRNRRPPRDPVNALLSFVYALITQEISSALYGVGLDPYIGFLHADRPGRQSLALDLLEEFRAWWADRLVLSLINRQQLSPSDFATEISGAVRLKPDARKTVLVAYQERKRAAVKHPFLQEEVPIGLLPYAQALLLARHLRGDLAQYPPFAVK
jgi:CRISPR-associated protein Cas1